MRMSRPAFLAALVLLGLTSALAACGNGNNGSSSAEPVTLYYVVTECHEDARTVVGSQRLEVLRGDEAPVVLKEITRSTYGQFPAVGLCPLYGETRTGDPAAYALAFQRIGVSPDGTDIVFEVNFEFSIWRTLGVRNPLTAEQQGIFFVHADGTGLRRLGDPSREYAQKLGGIPSPSAPSVPVYLNLFFGFSPDGKTIVFTDRGPGPAGEDAAQVVIMDVAGGTRIPVTTLPLVTTPDPSNPVAPAILYAYFGDNDTIGFVSRANPTDPEHPDGLNPEGIFHQFQVKKDGTGLALVPDADPVALPGSHFEPHYTITRPVTDSFAFFLSVRGIPVNSPPPGSYPPDPPIQELFLGNSDSGQLLQLTNLGRYDSRDATVDSDAQRVIFLASADRFGTNPSGNCQLFSVTPFGDDLRQLTTFSGSGRTPWGCGLGNNGVTDFNRDGCFIGGTWGPEMETLVFYSDCDPLDTNPAGGQLFAMHSDGTGLRQLTSVRGMVTNTDGSVDVELPGPIEIRF